MKKESNHQAKVNLGVLDRTVRLAMSSLLFTGAYLGDTTEGFILMVAVFGAMLFFSAAGGTCPVYWILKVDTSDSGDPKRPLNQSKSLKTEEYEYPKRSSRIWQKQD